VRTRGRGGAALSGSTAQIGAGFRMELDVDEESPVRRPVAQVMVVVAGSDASLCAVFRRDVDLMDRLAAGLVGQTASVRRPHRAVIVPARPHA
jgi:hypothetical protein